MKILIIEDEKELAQDIAKYLIGEDYLCEVADTFDRALEKIAIYEYDCILLDLMLPNGNGLDLLKLLKREHKQDGVIIISAKNSVEDKIKGLEIGADDYLGKPFHQAELMARIHSVIRRKQFHSTDLLQQNELTIDFTGKEVKINKTEVALTKKEYDLLLFFVGNKNRVLSKGAIAEHLSGDFADMFDNHDFVYAHIKNLKRKLIQAGGENHIKTIYGTGYKWMA